MDRTPDLSKQAQTLDQAVDLAANHARYISRSGAATACPRVDLRELISRETSADERGVP